VQSWYQGGVSVFDWTDATYPTEIAYFDRGAIDSTKMVEGGTWSAYWYNGYIYSSEITRGLDVLALRPEPLDHAERVGRGEDGCRFDQLNVQDQPKFVWRPSPRIGAGVSRSVGAGRRVVSGSAGCGGAGSRGRGEAAGGCAQGGHSRRWRRGWTGMSRRPRMVRGQDARGSGASDCGA